jgi:hypothetical protein
MNISVTGDPVIDNLKNRKESFDKEIQKLAYERLRLMRRVDEIDDTLQQLEGAQIANDLVQKDIDTREAIIQAQKEKQNKEV